MTESVTSMVDLVSVGLLKASVILSVGLGASRWRCGRLFGQRNVWLACFLGLAALPILEAVLPAFRIPVVDVPHGLMANELGSGALHLSLSSAVLSAWAVGTGVILLALGVDCVKAYLLAERAVPVVDRRLIDLLDRARLRIGVRSSIRLRVTNQLATPALVGWWNPALLLPEESLKWTDEELSGVLCHELHHVRRLDPLTNLVERVIGAAFWPNPLIHAVRRRAAFDRELAADRAALDAGTSAETFAMTLIGIAHRMRNDRPPATALPFGPRTGFEARVHALFVAPEPSSSSPFRLAAAAALFALLLALLAACTPATCIPGAAAKTTRGLC
jgi:beta-lactamase regulating signal transducer with metallopeptidase domain